MGSWIKLYRGIRESAVFDDAETLRLWLWLLCEAAYEETDRIVGKKTVHLMPGEMVIKRALLAERFGVSESKIYRSLQLLQELGNIILQPNNKNTVVTIVNWEKYQEKTAEPNNKRTANEQQTNNKRTTKNPLQFNYNKEIKEINNKRIYNTRARREAPELEEIKAYCTERQNNVDADRFYDYYTARGWKVGTCLIEDWKSLVRLWEKNAYEVGEGTSGRYIDLSLFDEALSRRDVN